MAKITCKHCGTELTKSTWSGMTYRFRDSLGGIKCISIGEVKFHEPAEHKTPEETIEAQEKRIEYLERKVAGYEIRLKTFVEKSIKLQQGNESKKLKI